MPVETAVTFDSTGITTSGVSHTAGTAGITLTTAGTYKVTFSVSGTQPNQFALFVNGAPAAGGIYSTGGGTQQNTGQVIVTVAAGGVLTLVNHTSTVGAVTLAPSIAGTQTADVNASVAVERLG